MNANADSELDTFFLLQTSMQVSHGSEDTQACAYCSVSVILMGLGIAKVHQESIPKELGDMPIVALDNVGTHPLIGTHHVTPVFWVELSRQGSGIHQITEHDRELSPFSFGCRRGTSRRCWLDRCCFLGRRR